MHIVDIQFIKKKKLLQNKLNLSSGNLKEKLLLMENPLGGCSTLLLRRSILEELDGFDTNFTRHQDWELLIRFFRKYKIAYINRILVERHLDDRNNAVDPEKMILIKEKYLKKFKKVIDEMNLDIQKEIYKRHYLEISRAFLKEKKMAKALSYYQKSKTYSKLSFIDYVKLIITLLDSIIPIKDQILINLKRLPINFYFNNLLIMFNR